MDGMEFHCDINFRYHSLSLGDLSPQVLLFTSELQIIFYPNVFNKIYKKNINLHGILHIINYSIFPHDSKMRGHFKDSNNA